LIRIDRFRDLPINAPERLIQIRGRHVTGAELVLSFQESTLNYKHVMDGPAASLYQSILQLKAALRRAGDIHGQEHLWRRGNDEPLRYLSRT
jgi:hypothetical protein